MIRLVAGWERRAGSAELRAEMTRAASLAMRCGEGRQESDFSQFADLR